MPPPSLFYGYFAKKIRGVLYNYMNKEMQSLIKLLLDLHKTLLDLEKEAYERKNGIISNNNEYFSLVINHEDFRWLRLLSETIALIDEEIEQNNSNSNILKDLLTDLDNLLNENGETEFSLRFRLALEKSALLRSLNSQVKSAISPVLGESD